MRANPSSAWIPALASAQHTRHLHGPGRRLCRESLSAYHSGACRVEPALLCRCLPSSRRPPGGKIVRRLRMDVTPAPASKTRSCSRRKKNVGSLRRPNREKDEFHFFAWSDLNWTVTRLLGLGHDLDQRTGGSRVLGTRHRDIKAMSGRYAEAPVVDSSAFRPTDSV